MSKETATSAGAAVAAGNLPKAGQDFTLQNISAADPAYYRFGASKTATAQANFRLAAGESIVAKTDLTNQQFQNASKGIHAITDANDVDYILDTGE